MKVALIERDGFFFFLNETISLKTTTKVGVEPLSVSGNFYIHRRKLRTS